MGTTRMKRETELANQDSGHPGAPVTVSNDEIARRAYALYLARGCGPGQDVEDWLRAEQELAGAAVVARTGEGADVT